MRLSVRDVALWLVCCAAIYVVYRLLAPYVASDALRAVTAAVLIVAVALTAAIGFYAYRKP